MNARLMPYVVLVCCSALGGCKKKSSAQENTAPQAPASNPGNDFDQQTTEYVKFTIGTTSYSFTPPQSGTWANGSSNILQGSAPQPNIAEFDLSVYSGNNIVFSIERLDSTRETGNTPSATALVNSIKEGNYKYSSGYADLNQRLGVSLSFKDSQNTTWNTQNYNNSGLTFQGTATFNVVKRITWSENNFTYNKIKATMTCKVYNQNGDSAQVTNGEIIIKFFK